MKRGISLNSHNQATAAPVFSPHIFGRLLAAGLAPYPRPVLLLLGVAFFLRTCTLDSQSLRGDEAATVHYSAMPVGELWELARITDPHPPLYYLLLHPWQWWLGEEVWTMRFAGVLASVLAVAALYRLGRQTHRSAFISLLAAGLLAVNPLQVWLAQDVRSYALFTLLGLLSAGALWSALHSSQRAATRGQQISRPKPSVELSQVSVGQGVRQSGPWLLYLFFTVACFYTHYYSIFLIAFEGMFVLLNARKFWDSKWAWLASQLALGLAILPGLQLAYNFAGQAAGGIETIATPDILRLASTALLTGFTISDSWGLWLSLLLAPLWLAGLVSLLRHDRTSGLFWALFFAAPVLGVIALSVGRPFFKERFLIQAQPAFEMLLAAGFLALFAMANRRIGEWAAKRERMSQDPYPARLAGSQPAIRYALRFLAPLLLGLLLLGNTVALANYFTNPVYAKATPWRLYHDHIKDHARPGDVVLTNFPEAAVSYYSPNELPFYVVPAERDRSVDFRLEQTAAIAQNYRRVWFLPLMHQGFDEEGEVLRWLDRHADRVDQVFFPSYNLNLYLGLAAMDELLVPQPVTFANGLHLRGYQILDKAGNSRLILAANSNVGQAADAKTLAEATARGADGVLMLAVEPREKFTLSLYWSAAGPTPVPYTVFTHLVAPDGFVRTGWDNQPVWGGYPTTAWLPGEQVTDKYTLTVPEGTPPGDNYLVIGWYQSDTLARAPELNAAGQPVDDQVTLDIIVRVE